MFPLLLEGARSEPQGG